MSKSNSENKNEPLITLKSNLFFSAYKTGGIPLVLVLCGFAMISEASRNWFPDNPTGVSNQVFFLGGIVLMLAGAARVQTHSNPVTY